jgi:hypothetical protein
MFVSGGLGSCYISSKKHGFNVDLLVWLLLGGFTEHIIYRAALSIIALAITAT